ncbi:MAG: nucleotide pyrophosphohydrolase [Candidatus Marsarchaeota archaeon]|nr:nucleotide pyrophosphohydrolase [Candidatus Marsarchaeota archaeon]
MDDETTIGQMKTEAARFYKDRGWHHGPKDLAISTAIESAELLEIFRFRSEEEVKELLKDPEFSKSLRDEISDVALNLFGLAQTCGVDMSEAFMQKMRENVKRYPAKPE